MVMTFWKWPDSLKRLALKHELLTDILAGFTIWAILGLISKTLAAVAGAVVGDILLALTLHYYKGQYDAGKVLQRHTKGS
mgnify:FL=1